ncbi:PREDICTED: uncharacterized protein K02A2.6-like [Cyphomyrmex costatus]|uniref:uncharacterized protein K02A2.6-like n=1 Tax=Cyphomyrmex costatus TaxID=456900 RepID=UPI000852273B|nr:PREDICTED: uncharacterized protein K02A2.6-like [Cyphomyrmex costatus]
MSTTDLLKFQKDLEEREKVLAERAKQQEHQRSLLVMESQQLAQARAELRAASKKEEPQVIHTIVRGTVGNISEFSMKEDYTRWFERVMLYFTGNEVPCEKQPQPSTIAQRYKFKECKQLTGEDIKTYLAKLKKLSTHCHFEEQLENCIRDQFVWGLASVRIKKRLLAEQQLTYTRAVEISTSMEMAERDAADMANSVNSTGNALNVINKQKKVLQTVTCFCCGKKGHMAKECRFKGYSCNSCGKKGHLESVCKVQASNKGVKGKSPKQSRANGNVKIKNVNPNNVKESEDNTGSPISAISEKDFDRLKPFENAVVLKSSRTFKAYTGNPIVPLDILKVKVTFQNRSKVLELFVLPGKSAPIVGRNWLKALDIIQFDLASEKLSVRTVNEKQNDICKRFESLFSNEIGCYTKKKFKLHLKEGVSPVFCKPRPVPFALRAKIENEIDRLVKDGILEAVEYSDWATLIVPVPKVNVDKHPIPRVSDLLTKLSGGTVFTKLDLAQAYQQVELDEESKLLVTITTHKGLFKSNRLSYGVASVPGLFQREMDKIFQDLDMVAIFFDDLVVTGATREEHDRNLTCVLKRLQDCGLTLSKDKCAFAQSNIEFLGFE